MADALAALLCATDLDELRDARGAIDSLDEDDDARIAAVLDDWCDGQAVANLLLHPDVIPEERRVDALLRGLREARDDYLVLAAVVGLQQLAEASGVPADYRRVLTVALLDVIAARDDVAAARASVTVTHYIQRGEVRRVVALLGHRNDAVRHNLVALLLDLVGVDGVLDLLDAAEATGSLPDQVVERVRGTLAAAGIDLDDPVAANGALRGSPLVTPRLVAVPNRAEMPAQPPR